MTHSDSNINPAFQRTPQVEYTVDQCIVGIQDYKILSFLISKSESQLQVDQDFVEQVVSQLETNKFTKRIAISGAPGVGKSTFINSLGQALVKNGNSIAILPVDPSSHISRGSILGDKTRMEDLVNLDHVFIKPMASSLALGGVAPATELATSLCAYAGFDYVFIETVGVGQSEYEVRHLVDLFLLLLQPGGGDDLQGIKRGIMEMADILIVTKADGELKTKADHSFKEYGNALKLMLANNLGWKTKIKKYSSVSGEGLTNLLDCLDQYFSFLNKENRLDTLRNTQQEYLFNKLYEKMIVNHFNSKDNLQKQILELKEKLLNKEMLIHQVKSKMQQLIHEV